MDVASSDSDDRFLAFLCIYYVKIMRGSMVTLKLL